MPQRKAISRIIHELATSSAHGHDKTVVSLALAIQRSVDQQQVPPCGAHYDNGQRVQSANEIQRAQGREFIVIDIEGRPYQSKTASPSHIVDGRSAVVEGIDYNGNPVMIKIYAENLQSKAINQGQKLEKLSQFSGFEQHVVLLMKFSAAAVMEKRHKCPVLVMQPGALNLQQLIKRLPPQRAFDLVVPLMKKIAQSLQWCHATARLVHGDIKLENVVNFGEVFPDFKLIDFENSRFFEEGWSVVQSIVLRNLLFSY